MKSKYQLSTLGSGLSRPECVLCHESGLVFVPNWDKSGGISVINSTNSTTHIFSDSPQKPVKPNGIALESGGNFLLAHLGDEDGGVYRLHATGELSQLVTHANGIPLPPTNFVTTDSHNRIWITVSTTKQPRSADYRRSAKTGFIAVAQQGETNARIVAEGLGYTNECVVDLERSAVFVNETFARRLSRFDLAEDGALSNKTTVTEFTAGTYPDGVAMDNTGNFWITSIVSNRIIRVAPNGQQTLITEDADNSFVNAAEFAYESDGMDTSHLANTGNTTLKNTSSLAFGGNKGTTVVVGNLLGDCLHTFTADVAGKKPVHWDVSLGQLETYL